MDDARGVRVRGRARAPTRRACPPSRAGGQRPARRARPRPRPAARPPRPPGHRAPPRLRRRSTPCGSDALLAEARAAYRAGDHARAIPRLAALVDRFPDHATAQHAADLWLAALDHARRYDELERAVLALRRNPRLALDRDHRQRLDDLHAQLLFRRATLDAEALAWPACATGFERVVHDHPRSRLGPMALHNAARCWWSAGDRARAEQALYDLLARYPRDPLAAHARESLVQLQGGGPLRPSD
ncbi:MAG: tetratricopeptide repeat protein [Kofleriaceae bacterium]|nr:tetratricopeptide repeat protein [Kofleriaceae bacterium]